jgi:hypothetical protein
MSLENNNMELFHIAYISKNAIEGSTALVQEEIHKILQAAHRNNPEKGITGALLYSGGYFCQVIEGSEEALEELFENIQMDDRHREVAVLHFEPIEERNFANWSMALAGIEDDARFNLDGLLLSKDEIEMKKTGENIVATLEELIKQHQKLGSYGT